MIYVDRIVGHYIVSIVDTDSKFKFFSNSLNTGGSIYNVMSTRALTNDTVALGGSTQYIRGDLDPESFSYTVPLTRAELLALFLRNSKVKKACSWFASEMLRERWAFDQDEAIMGTKHGVPFEFKQFNDWLEWNGFMQEVLKALMWALLFGESILVFYTEADQKSNKWKQTDKLYLKGGQGSFVKCKAFYEEINQNGYMIEDVDNFYGVPETYRISLSTYKAKQVVKYYVDANTRVVRFCAPQMELKYSGTSSVSTIAKDCIVQELSKRASAIQLMNVQAGILACRVSGKTEKTELEAEIATTLTHLKRIFAAGNMPFEEMFKIIVPDLKIDQLTAMNELMQQDIATGIDMSISNLEGAPQGALSSAEYDTFNTYSKVKQLQSHFKRAFEECFFKLGKQKTAFQFYDPTPQIGMNNPNVPGQQDGTSSDSPDSPDGEEGDREGTD